MATRQWAVTADGTFDFNDPANWVFGTVPGAFDVAQFATFAHDTVTGNATVAQILVTEDTIHLTGSYTMSGAQGIELSLINASLFIDAGASISGTGQISLNTSDLFLSGTLAGYAAAVNSSVLSLDPGSVFDIGSSAFSNINDLEVASVIALELDNAIEVLGPIAAIGTQLTIAGTISDTGSLVVW